MPASHSVAFALGYGLACRLGEGVARASISSGSKTPAIRSQLPPEFPSLVRSASRATQVVATRQLRSASQVVCRIAPRPTNADEPNVARSVEPSRSSAVRLAGLRANTPTAPSALSTGRASVATFGSTRIAVRAVELRRREVGPSTLAAGCRSREIAAVSSSTGPSVRSALWVAPAAGGKRSMPSPSESPARSRAPSVSELWPTSCASSGASGASAVVAAAAPRTNSPRRVSRAESMASTRCNGGISGAVVAIVSLIASPRPASASPRAPIVLRSAARPSGSNTARASSISTPERALASPSVPFSGIVRRLLPGTSSTNLPPSTDASRTSAVVSAGSGATSLVSSTSSTAWGGTLPLRGTASIASTWPTRAPPTRTSVFLISLPASGTAIRTL